MTEIVLPNGPGNFLATSEAMGLGHPDKVADQVAEAMVDAYLEQDPDSILAVEVVTKTGMIMVFGTASSKATIDFDKVVRGTIKHIGYDATDKGLDYKSMEVLNRLDTEPSLDDGDSEGLFVGYATNETPELTPLTQQLSAELCEVLGTFETQRKMPWLRPDGKAQVTLEYKKMQDGSVRPVRAHTILVSVQHAVDVPIDRVRSEVIKHVIKSVIPANLLDGDTQLIVNPSGRFVIGGPRGDAGVSGRQGVADSCGAWSPHGGASAVGKNGSKVERCGIYAARWVAKSLVNAGFASRCSVQIAYSSGKAEPLSFSVDSFGSARSGLSDKELCDVIAKHFDLRPGTLVRDLQLRKPQFSRFATLGFCGRSDAPSPQWEKCKNLTGSSLQAGIWQ